MELFSPLHLKFGWERHMMRFNEGIEAIYAVKRIRELHQPRKISGEINGIEYTYEGCSECWEQTTGRKDRVFDFSHVVYPCSTIKALDGE